MAGNSTLAEIIGLHRAVGIFGFIEGKSGSTTAKVAGWDTWEMGAMDGEIFE